MSSDSTRALRIRWQSFAATVRAFSLVGLIGPALLYMCLVLVSSLLILFANSILTFTGMQIERSLTLEAYRQFFTDPFYWRVLLTGIRLAAVTTCVCLLLGYPAAYGISRLRNPTVVLLSSVVIFAPLLVSVIVRSYGWLLLLGDRGLVNYVLLSLRVMQEPMRLIFNFTGVAIGMIHVLLPFAVFPILSVLVQQDPTLREAAADLGSNKLQILWHITFPLSVPGVLSAFQLCFVLAMSAYVSPRLLGGGRVMVLPALIFDNIATRNWPLASVQAMTLLVLVLLIVGGTTALSRRLYRRIEGQT